MHIKARPEHRYSDKNNCECCKHSHTKLDSVLSDLHFDNGASGWNILEHAHQQHPNCQLILMSTRKITQTPELMLGIPKLTTLAKPITETTMRNTLSKKYIS
jgi:response regulator of citrate/malate metabolism